MRLLCFILLLFQSIPTLSQDWYSPNRHGFQEGLVLDNKGNWLYGYIFYDTPIEMQRGIVFKSIWGERRYKAEDIDGYMIDGLLRIPNEFKSRFVVVRNEGPISSVESYSNALDATNLNNKDETNLTSFKTKKYWLKQDGSALSADKVTWSRLADLIADNEPVSDSVRALSTDLYLEEVQRIVDRYNSNYLRQNAGLNAWEQQLRKLRDLGASYAKSKEWDQYFTNKKQLASALSSQMEIGAAQIELTGGLGIAKLLSQNKHELDMAIALADLFFSQGNVLEAQELYSRAADLNEKVGDGSRHTQLQLQNGRAFLRLRRFAKAKQVLEPLLTDANPKARSELAFYEGEIMLAQGRYTKARRRYQTLEDNESFSRLKSLKASSAEKLGDIEYETGNYNEAFEYWQLAEDRYRRSGSRIALNRLKLKIANLRDYLYRTTPSEQKKLFLLLALRDDSKRQKQLQLAWEGIEKGLSDQINYLTNKHPELGDGYLSEGLNEISIPIDHREQGELFLKTLIYYTAEILGREHIDIALYYYSLGLLEFRSFERNIAKLLLDKAYSREVDKMPDIESFQRSLDYFGKAASIYQTNLGPKNQELARVYLHKARLVRSFHFYSLLHLKELTSWIDGRPPASSDEEAQMIRAVNENIDFYQRNAPQWPNQISGTIQQALVANIVSFNDDEPSVTPEVTPVQLTGDGVFCFSNKIFHETLFLKARYSLSFDNPMLKESLEAYDNHLDLLIQSLENQEDQFVVAQNAIEDRITASDLYLAANMEADAFRIREKTKSLILLSDLEKINQAQTDGLNLRNYQSLLFKIRHYENVSVMSRNAGLRDAYADSLQQAREQLANLSSIAGNERSPTLFSPNVASIEDIQQLLDPETAVLEYFTVDKVFIITKNNFEIRELRRLDRKIEDLDKTIKGYRNAILYRVTDNIYETGRELYRSLIPKLPANVTNLVIIPTGSLNSLPFEALIAERAKKDARADSDFRYLIHNYAVSYAFSSTIWRNQRLRSKNVSRKVLALAPVFRDEVETTTATANSLEQFVKLDTTGTRAFLLDGSYVSAIPGTEEEINELNRLLSDKGRTVTRLMHADASEGSLKSEVLQQYEIIHFATHGFVNEENPDLSGLVLAPVKDTGEDGILYTGEIYSLELNADLVVLSACETGLGRVQAGEGVLGLSRAFVYAGAKNQLISFWKVSDEATTELILKFYEEFLSEGKDYSSALQEAKLTMIANAEYSDPYYWAPFVLIGK